MNPLLFSNGNELSRERAQRRLTVRRLKKLAKAALWLLFSVVLAILICNFWVVYSTKKAIFFNVNTLPSNDYALVLGTNRFVAKGKENLFFTYRMQATSRLYKEGKIKYIILSGNNDSEYYNEPEDMKNVLVGMGIPSEVMTLDFAGFRTFDSVVRAKDVFKKKKLTIISQNFHNARALYICQQQGVEAVAFAAQDVPGGYPLKTLLREYMARPKAMIDLFFISPFVKKGNQEIK